MKFIKTVSEMHAWRQENASSRVGFVPTMGCLHEGHLSLGMMKPVLFNQSSCQSQKIVKAAQEQADLIVVSIFVNPSQFAPTEDLDVYPRTIDDDISSLNSLSRPPDCLFLPPVSEMYPSGITQHVRDQKGTFVEVTGMHQVLEGKIRPHFFRGVATIVTKLFCAVQPNVAIFGQKDAQQCTVIKQMTKDLLMNIEIMIAPTIREHDGLAMSSRNRFLTKNERIEATVLFKAFNEAEKVYTNGEDDCDTLCNAVIEYVKKNSSLQVQYVSLNHPMTLAPLQRIDKSTGALLSGALLTDKGVRLIDNILLDCVL